MTEKNDKKFSNHNKPNYPLETRVDARELYELDGLTIPQISKKLDVTDRALRYWAGKGNWLSKVIQKEKEVKITRELIIRKAAKMGMPLDSVIQAIVDGIQNPKVTTVIGEDTATKKPITYEEIDYKTRLTYIKELTDLMGLKDKKKDGGLLGGIKAGEGGVVNVQVMLPPLKEEGEK